MLRTKAEGTDWPLSPIWKRKYSIIWSYVNLRVGVIDFGDEQRVEVRAPSMSEELFADENGSNEVAQ